MSMERSRRERFGSQPPPMTWEPPLLVCLLGGFLVVMTPLLVQALVGLLLAGDFAWPTGHISAALAGLARGRFGGGLEPALASALLPDPVMWAATAVAEMLVLGSLVVFVLWARELLGVGSRRGLATSAQAAEALGVRRLRKNAAVVRPDLYARSHASRTGGRQ